MADLPISLLPVLTASTANNIIPVVASGITRHITRDAFIPRAFAQYLAVKDQSLSANTTTTVALDTISAEYLISLSADTITFISGGTFLISASYQFSQGASSADVAFWFKKNGNEVPNSATHQSMSSNSKQTAMVTIIETFTPGETMNLRIRTTSNNTIIDNIAGSGDIPDAPAVILSITQVY